MSDSGSSFRKVFAQCWLAYKSCMRGNIRTLKAPHQDAPCSTITHTRLARFQPGIPQEITPYSASVLNCLAKNRNLAATSLQDRQGKESTTTATIPIEIVEAPDKRATLFRMIHRSFVHRPS
eukprot:3578667-Rhodomonas_salina.2